MEQKRVAINFCGGCNSLIERGHIAAAVRGVCGAGQVSVEYNKARAEYAVYISGCRVNCAERSFKPGAHKIVVAGESVDSRAFAESELGAVVITKLRELLERNAQSVEKESVCEEGG